MPFIARYRKEATGGLDGCRSAIEEKLAYYTELLERRKTVVDELTARAKTPDLARRIESIWVKSELEDLYLPFRPKRRTRATMAREKGYQPLADAIPRAGGERLDADADAWPARATSWPRRSRAADVRAGVRDPLSPQAVRVRAREEGTQQPTKFGCTTTSAKLVACPPTDTSPSRRGGKACFVRLGWTKARGKDLVGLSGPGSPLANESYASVDDAMGQLIAPASDRGERRPEAPPDADAIDIFAQEPESSCSRRRSDAVWCSASTSQRTGCRVRGRRTTPDVSVEHTLSHENLITGDAALAQAKTIAALVAKVGPYAVAVRQRHARPRDRRLRSKQVLARRTTIMVVPSTVGRFRVLCKRRRARVPGSRT